MKETDTADVTTFLSDWTDAERTRDLDFLEDSLTDDFVGIGPLGFALPKPAWIARHQGDDLRYDTFGLDEIDVRTHGPVAIATARQARWARSGATPCPRSCATRSSWSTTVPGGGWPAST